LVMKRPGTGLMANELSRIIGKKARHDLPADHLLNFEDLE